MATQAGKEDNEHGTQNARKNGGTAPALHPGATPHRLTTPAPPALPPTPDTPEKPRLTRRDGACRRGTEYDARLCVECPHRASMERSIETGRVAGEGPEFASYQVTKQGNKTQLQCRAPAMPSVAKAQGCETTTITSQTAGGLVPPPPSGIMLRLLCALLPLSLIHI